MDLENLLENDRKVFFVNIYNLLFCHSLVRSAPRNWYVNLDMETDSSYQLRHGSPANLGDWLVFGSRTSYCIGGHRFTLDDIEHGILRGELSPAGYVTVSGHVVNPVSCINSK